MRTGPTRSPSPRSCNSRIKKISLGRMRLPSKPRNRSPMIRRSPSSGRPSFTSSALNPSLPAQTCTAKATSNRTRRGNSSGKHRSKMCEYRAAHYCGSLRSLDLARFTARPSRRFLATRCRPENRWKVALPSTKSTRFPPAWVRVEPAKYFKTLFIPGYEGMPELPLKDYWIDQYEVPNKQFKTFVDQGGYQKRDYWKINFVRDGKLLSFDEAMQLFRDATGRPGPKDRVQGEYPKGQDDFPVTGISWYEAAAFAQFAGKSLPTVYHWNRAAGPFSASFIVPASNFGSTGILPVGSKPDMSPWGNYDMAGNVKEWVWNEADPGKRYVLGGAWDEPNYMFIDPDAQSPFLRAPNIGLRCVKYIEPDSIPAVATAAMPSPRRDLSKEKPVSDQLFQAYRSLYVYDQLLLDATVEKLPDSDEWTGEKVTYKAAYGNERAISYLLLPKRGKPPFQTVVFFPGSNALLLRKFAIYPTSALDGFLRSGRAVIYPVYKSTYERGDGMESDVANTSNTWRDHVVMWVKDASRAIDYVQTRPDLDHNKIAYYGYSWGAEMGAIVPQLSPASKPACLRWAASTSNTRFPKSTSSTSSHA